MLGFNGRAGVQGPDGELVSNWQSCVQLHVQLGAAMPTSFWKIVAEHKRATRNSDLNINNDIAEHHLQTNRRPWYIHWSRELSGHMLGRFLFSEWLAVKAVNCCCLVLCNAWTLGAAQNCKWTYFVFEISYFRAFFSPIYSSISSCHRLFCLPQHCLPTISHQSVLQCGN